jgi:dihydroxyacetone synthase
VATLKTYVFELKLTIPQPAIVNALVAARSSDKPTFINIRTTIGFGSRSAGEAKTHGAALGAEDIAHIKRTCGLNPEEHFHLPQEIYDFFSDAVPRGQALEADWQAKLDNYTEKRPDLATEFKLRVAGRMPDDWTKCIPNKEQLPTEPFSSRKSAGLVTNPLGERMHNFLIGTADLTPSCNVAFNNKVDFQSVSTSRMRYN